MAQSSDMVELDEWLESSRVKDILTEYLDEKDYQIYRALNENGRMSDTELGERVGLSRTAARRRRKNLQEEGLLDIIAVLILQEANLAYADVRVKFATDVTEEQIESFIDNEILYEEQIYEIDEYMGSYDLLIRVWDATLQDVKRYVARKLQNSPVVEEYETLPVIKTQKAWHKVINNSFYSEDETEED